MPESLPTSIAELQARLFAGDFTVNEALTWQQQHFHTGSLGNPAVVELMLDNWPLGSDYSKTEFKPLSGVALAHKDIFNLTSRAPGLGLGLSKDAPELQRADALECLHQNGAHQLASLHMAPLAFGATSSNVNLGSCTNPLNPQAMVGGSSSGSAVAVAKGWVYGSLGTDTAGSVRIPAASCGVVGLKTSHALISRRGCAPLAPALDSVGVLARSFADARAVLLGSLSRVRAQRLFAQTQRVDPALARVRLCLPTDLDAEVSARLLDFAKTLNRFWAAGEVENFHLLSQRAEMLMLSEMAQTHAAELTARPEPFNVPGRFSPTLPPALAESVLAGLAMPPVWREQALAQRGQFLQDFLTQAFGDFDFLILPALATPLPLLAEVEIGGPGFEAQKLLGLHSFMGFVNYLGLPALVAPVARDARGLPVCVQILARPDQDLALLGWADQHWSAVLGSKGQLGEFHASLSSHAPQVSLHC